MWQNGHTHRDGPPPTGNPNQNRNSTMLPPPNGEWTFEPTQKFDTTRYKLIQPFSEKYMEFLDLWDIFMDVVDRATNLSESAKFLYLYFDIFIFLKGLHCLFLELLNFFC